MDTPSLYTITKGPEQLQVDEKEILRYMGFNGKDADDSLRMLTAWALNEVKAGSVPKGIYAVNTIDIGKSNETNKLELGFGTFCSKDIMKYVENCEKVVIFASTIGIYTDRLVNKFSHISQLKALAVDSAGTALIEAFCDAACDELAAKAREAGYEMLPRFSAGYGDFPLECQKGLLEFLQADKFLGTTLNQSLLMTPSKSVTAIMGLEKL